MYVCLVSVGAYPLAVWYQVIFDATLGSPVLSQLVLRYLLEVEHCYLGRPPAHPATGGPLKVLPQTLPFPFSSPLPDLPVSLLPSPSRPLWPFLPPLRLARLSSSRQRSLLWAYLEDRESTPVRALEETLSSQSQPEPCGILTLSLPVLLEVALLLVVGVAVGGVVLVVAVVGGCSVRRW